MTGKLSPVRGARSGEEDEEVKAENKVEKRKEQSWVMGINLAWGDAVRLSISQVICTSRSVLVPRMYPRARPGLRKRQKERKRSEYEEMGKSPGRRKDMVKKRKQRGGKAIAAFVAQVLSSFDFGTCLIRLRTR
ncbi:hypothetical protein C8R47DRAFT_1078562 [Mycena vitilis]|nr:hypothetical protein C8R47DRAFT_1078562 [Mycena vitilis]